MKFKDLWDLESAMQVLGHKTVDSKLWAEAVEWLLHYGPPEIQQLLLDASEMATTKAFPELKPNHYGPGGEPSYDVRALAETLGITEEETLEILRKKEEKESDEQIAESAPGAVVH